MAARVVTLIHTWYTSSIATIFAEELYQQIIHHYQRFDNIRYPSIMAQLTMGVVPERSSRPAVPLRGLGEGFRIGYRYGEEGSRAKAGLGANLILALKKPDVIRPTPKERSGGRQGDGPAVHRVIPHCTREPYGGNPKEPSQGSCG